MNMQVTEDVYVVTKLAEKFKEELKQKDISDKEKEELLLDFIKKTLKDYKDLNDSEFKKKYKGAGL